MMKIFLLLIAIFSNSLFNLKTEDNEWQLAKNKSDILIYTRKVSYSNYKEFKGEIVVSANSDKVVSILRNIEMYKDWLPDCLESKRIHYMDDKQQINYILTDVPWPYEDRDLAYEFKVEHKSAKTIEILIHNKPDDVPKKKGIVRIPSAEGRWTITSVNRSKTKLVYQMHVEPGGFVPAWLANLKITDTPYGFLYNLREQVEK
jgi:hypothetical protein